MNIISSPDNKVIKNLVRLKKSHERTKQKLILVDGFRETFLAIRAGWVVNSLFFCPELNTDQRSWIELVNLVAPEKITQITSSLFNKVCYKEKPEGLLAVLEKKDLLVADIRLDKNPLVIILENVEKPGNLGAILRTAYAAGIKLIILNNHQTDIYNPNVIRASEGYVFLEQIIGLSVSETVNWLKKHKIISYGAATSSKTNYTKADFSGPSALVLGSEADGLSQEWLKKADKLVKIPMTKGMDSLNVSVSTAIIAFEALRQRSS
jgi:TrmH family RNA methyltransferase